jgi:hypothetical protein
MRVTISLDDQLAEQVRRAAEARDISMGPLSPERWLTF